jgi:very-long-chain enoyl-CoA reductase
MVSVTVFSNGKVPSFAREFPITIQLSGNHPTIVNVKQAIAARFPKVRVSRSRLLHEILNSHGTQFYASRQKITVKGDSTKALHDDTKVSEAGIVDGSELFVKDLGPQISWRTVFLVEYVRL